MAVNDKTLDITFQKLYTDDLPSFINSLKSMESLPDSMRDSIAIVEKNIEQNKAVLTPILADGLADIADTVSADMRSGKSVGSLFGKLSKKQYIKRLSGKRLIAIQDNANHFNDTIKRMKQLLRSEADTTPEYESLTFEEKEELLVLAEEMRTLSDELTEQLAA